MKKFAAVTLLSTLVLAGGALNAFAADVDTSKSKATLDFKLPKDPLRFTEGGATDIYFGEIAMSGDDATYNAIYNENAKFTEDGKAEKFAPLAVTIADDRGTKPGYSVNVEMTTQFTNNDDVNNVLDKSTITLSATQALTSKTAGDRVAPANFKSDIVLGVDGTSAAQDIFGADATQGAGTWTTFFGDLVDSTTQASQTPGDPDENVENESIELFIPGEATKVLNKAYTAELTWTLVDAPL